MSKKYYRICNYCENSKRFPNKKSLDDAEKKNKKCLNCRKSDFLSFDSAKIIVQKLGLKNQVAWQNWIKSEENKKHKIPTNPDVFYKDRGWVSYADWLGNNNYIFFKNIKYVSYGECKEFISKNFPEVSNRNKWNLLNKELLPLEIHKRPDSVYKGIGWVNWESFLNSPLSPRSKSILLLSFEDAKDYVTSKKISSESEYYYHIEVNQIKFLPLRPDVKYKEKWNGFIDFLSIRSLRKSSGEDRIKDVLELYNIPYEREKKFDGCKNKRRLPFDFYIESLKICIEYDGEFHHKSQKHFGGDPVLSRIKINDSIKNKWCEDNGINLIRISYKDKWKILEILKEKLGLN